MPTATGWRLWGKEVGSRDLNYIPANDELLAQTESVGRLLNGLIASTERRL